MHGYYNRILNIDLSKRLYDIELVEDRLLLECVGGKGLATRLLLERNPIGVDPLSPDNMIIIATGPFCGGRLWGGSRYGLYTKSPLTGCYAETYSGGKVPEAIDSVGFDAILLSGRADSPVVLTVTPDGVEFNDGSALWGMETFQAEEEAVARFSPGKAGYRRPGAITIGPAGENLVRFAIVANDKWRCAGRTGAGAVFGSKQVKAIVFQGDRTRGYADPGGVADYAASFLAEHRENPGVKSYKKMGTTMMVTLMNNVGAFPARYWNQGSCSHAENISGERYHQENEVVPHACAKCFMACGRMTRIARGRHAGLRLEGPEYETIYAFGGLCMIEEMEEVAYLNDLCDRLGMDTISAGNLCALIMEAAEQQRIEHPLCYGDFHGAAELLNQMASRDGIGDVLGEGIVPAARKLGIEDLAVQVKGLEPAGYDPRKLKGMGLAYGTSPRGACHLRTTFYKPELSGMIPPEQVTGKAALLIEFEDRLALFDALTLCRFYRDLYPWEELVKAYTLVTGLRVDADELRSKAAAIVDMTREFNLREGIGPEQDRLPARLHQQSLPEGGSLSKEDMELMLGEYYELRGWDKEEAKRG